MEEKKEKNLEGKPEEKSKQAPKKKVGKVVFECNIPSGWVIDDPVMGKHRVLKGEKVEFDPTDGNQLHYIIQVLRVINNPRRNITEHRDRKTKMHVQVHKFKVVSGLENLPKAIRETQMSYQEYTPAEKDAIDSLVEDFPPFRRKERKTIQVIS